MDAQTQNAKIAFSSHKWRAKDRGIEFCFTFKEWVLWWKQNLGPDWHRLRGNKWNSFVMARKSDRGPYCLDNVECITNRQNNLDQARNGKSFFGVGCSDPPLLKNFKDKPGVANLNGIKITSEIARSIYLMKDRQCRIAAHYGISDRLVRLIKKNKCGKMYYVICESLSCFK